MLHDLFNRKSNSYAYDYRQQNRAICSAENQVSIADNMVKNATSKLSMKVSALVAATDDYLANLNKLRSANVSNDSSAVSLSKDHASVQNKGANSSASQIRPVTESTSSASSLTSSESLGQALVSLSSDVGVIYSLVNKDMNH